MAQDLSKQLELDVCPMKESHYPLMYMTQCLYCDKKACSWSGHVHRDETTVIAGRCREHTSCYKVRDVATALGACMGCFGQWEPRDGAEWQHGN